LQLPNALDLKKFYKGFKRDFIDVIIGLVIGICITLLITMLPLAFTIYLQLANILLTCYILLKIQANSSKEKLDTVARAKKAAKARWNKKEEKQ
jgi:uncharacterized membrane protein